MEATPRPWEYISRDSMSWSPEGAVAELKQRGLVKETDGEYELPEMDANGSLIVEAVNKYATYRELQEAAEAAIKGKVLSNWATEGVWVCLVCGLEAREEHELIHDEDCWYAALCAALASVKGEGA